jgi:hypothetical protein
MMPTIRQIMVTAALVAGATAIFMTNRGENPMATPAAAVSGNPLDEIIQQRGLTPDEAEAAL